VGLERGPLSLVSTIEELLGRKSSCSGLESREYVRRGSAKLTTRHPSIRKKLALTSPTSGGRSVGIIHSRTKATEFSFSMCQTGVLKPICSMVRLSVGKESTCPATCPQAATTPGIPRGWAPYNGRTYLECLCDES
jgi:hypothetical protein